MPVPIFISDENKEYLADHWQETLADFKGSDEIPGNYFARELYDLADNWDKLNDHQRGVLVLACDLARDFA